MSVLTEFRLKFHVSIVILVRNVKCSVAIGRRWIKRWDKGFEKWGFVIRIWQPSFDGGYFKVILMAIQASILGLTRNAP